MCQRVGGNSVAPGAGRKRGPRLAMTEIRLWICQRVETQTVAQRSSTHRDCFQNLNFCMLGRYLMCSCPANKEGELWVQFGPTQCILGLMKGMQSEVIYRRQPSATAQRRQCKLHSALMVWAGNWKTVITVAQTESPSWQTVGNGNGV